MTPFEARDRWEGERFRALRLDGALVADKQFEGCTFERCRFSEVWFRACEFIDCTFERCDLSQGRWSGSALRGVTFQRSKVAGVDWTLAAWSAFRPIPALGFDDCTLDYGSFLGLELPGLRLINCRAREVDFSEAKLPRADFRGSDLSGSHFRHADLSEANLVGAENYAIDVTLTTMRGARVALPEALTLLHGLGIVLADEG